MYPFYVPIDVGKADRIRELLAEGLPPNQIAREVRCHRSYVYRISGQIEERISTRKLLEQVLREVISLRSEIRSYAQKPTDIVRLKLLQINGEQSGAEPS